MVPIRILVLALGLLGASCDKGAPTYPAGPAPQESLLAGAPAAKALYCDLDAEQAELLGNRRTVQVSGDGFVQLVDVERGPIGRPLERWGLGESHWIAVKTTRSSNDPCKAVSLQDGRVVVMPENSRKLRLAAVDKDRFWFMVATAPRTGSLPFSTKRGPETWHYGVYENGALEVLGPTDEPAGDPIVMHGALWAQTEKCLLQRMDRDGTECVDTIGTKSPYAPIALGADHIAYVHADFSKGQRWNLYNPHTRTPVTFHCGTPRLHGWVADPAAAVILCDGDLAYLWTPGKGAVPLDHPPEARTPWGSERERFLRLSHFDAPAKQYYDALAQEVVNSDFALVSANASGFGVGGDFAFNVETADETKLRFGDFDCPGFLGSTTLDTLGHWALLQCHEEMPTRYGDEARRRPSTITSCRTPAGPAARIVRLMLADLRDGTIHTLTGAKPIGLSSAGVVMMRGSGNDLVGADGVQIIVQPYPP